MTTPPFQGFKEGIEAMSGLRCDDPREIIRMRLRARRARMNRRCPACWLDWFNRLLIAHTLIACLNSHEHGSRARQWFFVAVAAMANIVAWPVRLLVLLMHGLAGRSVSR